MRLGRIAIFFALVMGVMAFSPAQDIKQAGDTEHNEATQHNATPLLGAKSVKPPKRRT